MTKSLYGLARTGVVNTRQYDIRRRYVAHISYAFNNRGIGNTLLKGRDLLGAHRSSQTTFRI